MMATQSTWRLESVVINDLLGFQGEKTFAFSEGLQVFEASNHCGKSSLALSLLWGLTGELPALSRVDKRSFSLTNKHSGSNASPHVRISMVSSDGSRMEIKRKYQKGNSTDGLELSLPDVELEGEEADLRILAELGIKASTLQGCGVVLQDHRLKFVTGTESEISDVVNDMLGLHALSEIVPIIQRLAGEADKLRKEIAAFLSAADPVARWEKEDNRLRVAHRLLQDAAVANGVTTEQLESPDDAAANELALVAEALETDGPSVNSSIRAEIIRLRGVLSRRRKESGEFEQLAKVKERLRAKERTAKAVETQLKRWEKHDLLVEEERSKGQTDQQVLLTQIAEADLTLSHYAETLTTVEGQKALLANGYSYLLGSGLPDSCPICELPVDLDELRNRLKRRVDVALVAEIDEINEKRAQAAARRASATNRLEELKELFASNDALCRTLEDLREQHDEVAKGVPSFGNSQKLIDDSASRRSLIVALTSLLAAMDSEASLLRDEEANADKKCTDREEQHFHPIDARINRVLECIVPLGESAQQMELHAATLESVNQREGALNDLGEKAKVLASQLKKTANAVSEDQKQSASEAINTRLPFVSQFFAKVACNPDYTGLTIETTVSKDKVAYRIRATSSKMAALTDFVGHVLSEGDLSAAGIALLMGLASGDSHRLGFLVLDDPGQGMDPQLQANLARELGVMARKPQIIVLTHQPDFAGALESHGGARRHLGHWEGGRLVESA